MVHLLLAVIYLSFISLGLPDSLLGAAWPSMYGEFGVPVSYAGGISMIIAAGTVVSSLQSDRFTRRFGAGKVTAVSVAMTALALLGFSVSRSFWPLCLWAIPYGLGAGSVDAALNNYVALHYSSRHMSWLHCMWGLGASLGPYIIGCVLSGGGTWNRGYRCVSLMQMGLALILFLSLPLWRAPAAEAEERQGRPLTLGEIFRIPGVKAVMLAFFCYCALEQTAMLWSGSYLALHKGLPAEDAAGYAGLFCAGIMVGRGLSGFLAAKLNDTQMIRLGQAVTALGIAAMLLPLGNVGVLAGLALTGLGCAPVYPCVIHSTPERFGADRSQAIIGVQMACAYVGTCFMPPLFGLMAAHIHVSLLPVFLLLLLLVMTAAHEALLHRTKKEGPGYRP